MVGPRNRREDSQQVASILFDRRPAPSAPAQPADVTVRNPQGSSPPHPRLREREDVLEELRASFRGFTRVGPIIIEGASGLGKTALLNAACRIAREENLAVLSARASQPESTFSFGVVRQLFEPILALLDPGHREKCLIELGSGVFSGSETPRDFSVVLEGLRSGVSFLAQSQPLLIAIDDLHWCDPESALWFEYMSRRLQHRRIWLIGSVLSRRDGEVGMAVDRVVADPPTRTFSLKPLSSSAVATLVTEQGSVPELEELAAECYRATKGNPFLLFSLLNWLRANPVDSTLSKIDEIGSAVPQAILRSLVSRTRMLPSGSFPLLQATAVLQQEAGLREASDLAGIDIEEAKSAADALAELNILGRGRPLSFVYPIERSAVYGDMGPASRATFHAHAAELLNVQGRAPAIVADHLLVTEPAGEGWRTELLIRAAASAESQGSPERAKRYLSRALIEPPTDALRGEVLVALALLEATLQSPEALSRLSEAMDSDVEPRRYAEATLKVAKSLSGDVSPKITLPILRSAAERLSEADDPDLRLSLELTIAQMDQSAKGALKATAILDRVLAGRLVGRTRAERLSLAYLCTSWVLSPDRFDARQLADIALQSIAGEDIDVADPVVVQGFVQALEAATFAGNLPEVEQIARTGEAAARRAKYPSSEAAFSTVLAHCLLQRGDLREAHASAQNALSLTRKTSSGTRRRVLRLAARVAIEQGHTVEAGNLLDDLFALDPRSEWLDEILGIECRGELRYCEGEIEASLNDFLTAGRLAEESGVRNPAVTTWRAGAARSFYATGDHRAAHELATENLAFARNFGAAIHVGSALRVMAEVVEPVERLALLDEAVNVLESTGASLEFARATLELGRTLRESNRHVAARNALRRAADLAVRCGAEHLIDRSLQELRASGARPRRLAFSGADALTPSERRVAEMAAAGMKNSHIAEILFVSPKTVEGHLSRAYQKLGIQSREELGAIASSISFPGDRSEIARNSA
jgi:DNA-binding CsgD family transcriptional regulator